MKGYCECGCGEKTSIAKSSNPKSGTIAGQPYRFLPNHHRRKNCKLYEIDDKTGCWVWLRAVKSSGYGNITVAGKTYQAHRYIYEKHRGKIPEGLILDHLCKNQLCVNPEHLEPVTYAENNRRGDGQFSNFRIHYEKLKNDPEYRRSYGQKLSLSRKKVK